MKKHPGWILPDLAKAQIRTSADIAIQRDCFAPNEVLKTLGINKTYFIRTYGCQANERDHETIAGIIEALGYTPADDIFAADFVILNTCAVRKNAEDKVFGEIGRFRHAKEENPDFMFALCGCMAQEEAVVDRILTTYPQVDLIFGTHNLHRLPDLLWQVVNEKQRTIEVFSKEGDIIENLPAKRNGQYKAWVNIMYGCDKFCTYCIVPYTRGKERSRLASDIMAEITELKQAGYQEVTLLGQNVNAYGKDIGWQGGFAALLEEVAQSGIPRIRFTTSHPWDFSDDMIDVIAKYDNIMKYIHLPMQSGNSDVLKLMGRRYTSEDYLSLFDRIKAKIPSCAFSTDIIVGFPGETEEQFLDTLRVAAHCTFDNAYTFVYSPRAGTPAAKMADTIPFKIKQQRLYALNEQVRGDARANNEAYGGRIVKVLVDGFSKKRKDIMSGYTETNKLVNFLAHHAKPGDIVNVRITQVRSFSLNGEQVD